MKSRFLFVFVTVLILFSAFCSSIEAASRPINVGMVHWVGNTPLNVADVKGFWKELGLEVSVTTFDTDQEAAEAFTRKKVDFFIAMIGSGLGFLLEGAPIVVLAETDWSHGGDKIILKKDTELAKIKGQKVGIYIDQPSVKFFLNKFLSKNGMNLSDFEIVEVEARALSDQFIAGRLPLIVHYDPHALRALKEGKGTIACTSADFPGCIPEGLMVRSDVLSQLPKEDVVKFMKGFIRAVKWIQDGKNTKELFQILHSKTFEGEPPCSDDDLKNMMSSIRLHDIKMLREANQDGGRLSGFLEEMHEFLRKANLLKVDFKPSEIQQSSYILEALNGE
ncbi:MAG: ABC transporter substrate-binding protein [Candidatus Ozemobacteraceae bacterium]